jgi:pimeloyl-ACP methyl ester carboxylesterase
MGRDDKPNVIFIHGGILPAAVQFAPLLKVLNSNIHPFLKELEIYHNNVLPGTYSLSIEVEGLHHAANQAGMDKFHIVSYSAGGTVALAYTGTYPERVSSLALIEPAVIPSQEWFADESDYWQQLRQAMSLSDQQLIQAYMRVELRQGARLPAPVLEEPQPWITSCVTSQKALVSAYSNFDLPYDRLKAYPSPVYIAVTEWSNPVELRKAELLKKLFPVSRMEVYPYRHHFDPPHQAEPEHFAWALISLWEKAKGI